MCDSTLHLSYPDRKMLKNLRIKPWDCPKCVPEKPKLRIEGERDARSDDSDPGRQQ